MRPVVAVAALAAALLSVALGKPAEAAVKPAGVRILSKSERTVLAGGKLRVAVRYRGVGRVRVLVRVPRGRSRKPVRIAKAKLVSFKRPGRRRVSLKLFRSGREYLRRRIRDCRSTRFVVFARARAYRRAGGRTLFSPRNKSSRSRFTKRARMLAPGRSACSPRGRDAPGSQGGGGGGAVGGGPGSGVGGGPGGGGSFGGPGGGRGDGVSIRAGAAQADITPPVGTPMFAYTARSNLADPPTDMEQFLQLAGGDRDPDKNLYAKTFEPSQGIHTRVGASAIVIQRGEKKFALAQADLGGLPYALTQEVVRKIESTGITAERLLLSATHTHSSTGPIWPADSMGYGALGGDFFDPRIFELTADGIADAILAAHARLEPARLGVGTANVTDASRNREFDPFRLNPDVPADEAAARAASIDPTVTVVRADAADGRPLGVWSNFAIHPTSFGDSNLLFSGDNAASAERVAESEITRLAAAAGNAPSGDRPVVNVWTNANEGDISPNGGPDQAAGDALQYVPNSYASANMAGRRVASGIVDAWRDAGGDMDGDAEIDARRTIMAFDGVTPADGRLVGPQPVLGFGVVDEGRCNPLGDPGPPEPQGKKMPLVGGPLIPNTAPVSVWQIGSSGIVALPSEVTKQQGKRIRDTLVADSGGRISSFALAGMTNSYNSYTSTPEEYDACTYEGSFTLFGRHQGPRYRDVSKMLLAALLAGTQAASLPEPPPTGLGGGADAVDETPDADDVVEEPALTVRRFERATFRWKGGDPAVDAPRGQTFVALQREVAPGSWRTVGTEEGLYDTTHFDEDSGVWTETWQFGECDPLGTYRFVVKGVADKGSGPAPYEVTSVSFELRPTLALQPAAPVVAGGKASVLVRYPNPGAALVALPRRVRTGEATFTVDPPGAPGPEDVPAALDDERLNFVADGVPDGSAVNVNSVEDSCGNRGP